MKNYAIRVEYSDGYEVVRVQAANGDAAMALVAALAGRFGARTLYFVSLPQPSDGVIS